MHANEVFTELEQYGGSYTVYIGLKIMPKRGDDEIPLPSGWDIDIDFDGKRFFIDHNTKTTSWVDPRDRYTKPQSFADCVGDELPYGWEQAFDPQVGVYYINHINHTNQLEDPRLLWREEQERMLKEYLVQANGDLDAKKEIFNVKQQRLAIAQEEVQHLNDSLAGWKASRTSLNSSSSVGSTKYDPDLLKVDVALAKTRVARIRREMDQIHHEMQYKERGLETLTQIDSKMNEAPHFTVDQAQEVLNRIRSNKKTLNSGEKEKEELVQSIAKLNGEFLRCKTTSGSSPDVSTLSLPTEKLSTASQTDLTGENVTPTSQMGEILKLRMRYDKAKKDVSQLQQQLAVVEAKIVPGQTESDKDRLLLIQEKEQLLRELRGINLQGKDELEVREILQQITGLEQDLKAAMEMSSQQIAERLKLNEEKSIILQQLTEAVRLTSYLESQRQSLSMSTLSVSSGSSRGSLGSLSASSSKGSLNSLSFTDIYGQTQLTSPGDPNLQDLYLRVEKSLQGHSVSPIPEVTQGVGETSEVYSQYVTAQAPEGQAVGLPPPPPTYQEHITRHKHVPTESVNVNNSHVNSNAIMAGRLNEASQPDTRIANLATTVAPPVSRILPPNVESSLSGNTNVLTSVTAAPPSCSFVNNSASRRTLTAADSSERLSNPPLSPISETSSGMCNNVSGGNTRSVSAAVSDESVAGDSGVFEASGKRSGDIDDVIDQNIEAAQVQIKLKYEGGEEGKLYIGLEQARNLSALPLVENCKVCLKASLLPASRHTDISFATSYSGNTDNPKFCEFFKLPTPENKLSSKTLQVNVWCQNADTEECLGSAQVSLADFDTKRVLLKWYNVLSFKFMQAEGQHSHSHGRKDKQAANMLPSAASNVHGSDKVAELLEESSARLRQSDSKEGSGFRSSHPTILSMREESSDESTIISSQTSTLTRNQGPRDMEGQNESPAVGGDSSESLEEEDELDHTLRNIQSPVVYDEEDDVEDEYDDGTIKIVTVDAETNTEMVLRHRKSKGQDDANKQTTVKRSQTFSPAVRVEEDRVVKLNRSDSDSSVPKYNRTPFKRNTPERCSLRFKKGTTVHHNRSKSVQDSHPNWTSLDLEMDLKASETKLSHLQDELSRLRELKKKMELAKSSGSPEVPSWLTENEQLQQFLIEAEKLSEKKNSKIERRAEHLLKKVTKEALKQKNHTDANSFREKMVFFTNSSLAVPVVPETDGDLDDIRLARPKSKQPMEV